MTQRHAPLTPEEQDRFRALMEDSYRKVYVLAYRLAQNRADAEDLTQEAFVRAYRSFRDFEGDRPFENWVYRITSRLFLDLLRSRRRRVNTVSYDNPLTPDGSSGTVTFEKADETPTPEQLMLEHTFSEEMERAMASLSEDQRQLLILSDVEEMTCEEIARLLQTSPGTVRSRLHRIRKRVRKELQTPHPALGLSLATSG